MNSKKRVFLAHAKEDAMWVRILYDFLKTIGMDPWMAPHDIIPGEQWDNAIRKALTTVDFVIACLSKNSIKKRGYVQREFRLSLDLCQEIPSTKLFLIPLRLDPCEVPDLQVGKINLRELQWVDAFSSDSLKLLLKSLGLLDSKPGRGVLNAYGEDSSLASIASSPRCYLSFKSSKEISDTMGLTHHIENLFLTDLYSPSGACTVYIPNGKNNSLTFLPAAGVDKLQILRNQADGSELIVVSKGEFLCGDPDVAKIFDNQLPNRDMQLVFVPTFAIAKYPTTNEKYKRFLDATGYSSVAQFGKSYAPEKANHPVVNVSWVDAS